MNEIERLAEFSSEMIDARLLGAVTVSVAGRQVQLGPVTRALAAALLASPGRPVTRDTLIERLSEVERPSPQKNPRAGLDDAVRALREALDKAYPGARDALQTGTQAYVMRVAPEQVDAHRFAAKLRQARDARRSDDRAAADLYLAALSQWPGRDYAQPDPPLAGLLGSHVEGIRQEYLTQHRAALGELLEVEIRLGRSADTLPILNRLATFEPEDERILELRMLALHGVGQSNEALVALRRHAARLRSRNATPCEALRTLYEQIQRGGPEIRARVGAADVPSGTDDTTARTASATSGQAPGNDDASPGTQDRSNADPAKTGRSGGVDISGGRVKIKYFAARDLRIEKPRGTA